LVIDYCSRFLDKRCFNDRLGNLCYFFWLVEYFSNRGACFNNLLLGLFMDRLRLRNFHDRNRFNNWNWF
jgi:hypothetical protein